MTGYLSTVLVGTCQLLFCSLLGRHGFWLRIFLLGANRNPVLFRVFELEFVCSFSCWRISRNSPILPACRNNPNHKPLAPCLSRFYRKSPEMPSLTPILDSRGSLPFICVTPCTCSANVALEILLPAPSSLASCASLKIRVGYSAAGGHPHSMHICPAWE